MVPGQPRYLPDVVLITHGPYCTKRTGWRARTRPDHGSGPRGPFPRQTGPTRSQRGEARAGPIGARIPAARTDLAGYTMPLARFWHQLGSSSARGRGRACQENIARGGKSVAARAPLPPPLCPRISPSPPMYRGRGDGIGMATVSHRTKEDLCGLRQAGGWLPQRSRVEEAGQRPVHYSP